MSNRYKGDKGIAWKYCSMYIRARDGHKCSTCHRSMRGGYQMQAGHFLPVGLVGSNNTLAWDETNMACQCAQCNGVGQGMQVKMREFLVRRHGEAHVRALEARCGAIDPIKDWKAMKEYYKGKYEQL